MLGRDLVQDVKRLREPGDYFISWWRKETDFLDIDLVDRFIENCGDEEEIGGFELLGMDAMWDRLVQVAANRVTKDIWGAEKQIVWQKENGETVECPLAPEVLMNIFDTETNDNYID